VIEGEKVALERDISLGAIGEVGEGSAESFSRALNQPQTCSGKKQRVDAAAQGATPRLDRLPHKPRPLTEEIHNKITWRGKNTHVGQCGPHWLERAVVGQWTLRGS
jgi:hypothetical protein